MNSHGSTAKPGRYQFMGVVCALLTFGVIATLHVSATSGTTTLEAFAISIASLLIFFPLLRSSKPQSPYRQYQRGYTTTLITMLGIVALFTSVQYLTISRPIVGGVDWYYYLCYSRDMVNSYPIAENAYSYFPGVYTFWTMAMRLVGQDLATLQTVYQLALVMVCLLTGWVVCQQTRCKTLTFFSLFWTLVLLTKFDGLTGVTECLAVIPWLIGLILWQGRSIDPEFSLWRLSLFGIAIGLTVYSKQQAGLLSLGFLYLLSEQVQQRPVQHSWRRLWLLPCIAATTLLLACLVMGDGLLPLSTGLKTVGQYGTEQSWLRNIYTQIRHDESLWLSTFIAILLFIGRRRWLKNQFSSSNSTWRMAGFTLFATLAALLQFRARPFHHYMLLCIPAMVIFCSLMFHHYRSWLQKTRLKRFFVGLILILPSIWCAPYNDSYHPLRLRPPETVEWDRQHHPFHDDQMQAIISELDEQVPAESRMLIMPGRYNQIHFAIETLSDAESGYNFRTRQFSASGNLWQQPLENTSAEYVLFLTGKVLSEAEQQIWTERRLSQASSTLAARGYQLIPNAISVEHGLLFRK